MKVMIDIDEDTYRYMQSRCQYQNKGDKGLSKFEEVGVAIKNGTPLPKGHGRLIDTDKTISKICGSSCGCHLEECGRDKPCYSVTRIESASTIIEADKESENA